MKLAIFMDLIEDLDTALDSTLLIIQRAQAIGWSCVYFTHKDLFCQAGQVYAEIYDLKINESLLDSAQNWATVTNLGIKSLSEFDIILIRKDPPFDSEYIYATYMLELAERDGVIISNKPQSLRDANEKMFTLWFKDCCPETLVSCNINRLREFWRTNKHVIFKPLDGMGGNGVCEVGPDGQNLGVILELLTHKQTVNIMAQTYIPEIRVSGDKRIILINGEPVKYGLARIPAKGEVRGNLKAGGTGHIVELTNRDRKLCAQLAPTLKAKNLHLVGIDVIGDYITEINVTSTSCLRDITNTTGLDIAGDYLTFLENIRNN